MIKYNIVYDNFYTYSGNGMLRQESLCHVKILSNEDRTVVVITEAPQNKGMSITNAAEEIATKIVKEFKLPLEKTTWIEHYVHSDVFDGEETYDQIVFIWNNKKAASPRWNPMPKMTFEEIVGEK
jgi:hypothetical protein